MPVDNQINAISTMMCSMIGFMVVAVDSIKDGDGFAFSSGYMGSKGLLTAFLVAFFTANLYKFFIKRNITVKMPDAVPPNISQTFKDVIPFGACILLLTIFDFFFRKQFDMCFAQAVIQVFQPLFTAD